MALGWEADRNFGFDYNISATAEASDFKFSAQLGFAKDQQKSHAEEKGAWPWIKGSPTIWRFPFNIYTMAEDSDFKFGTAWVCQGLS